jgi:hypothetical protein
MHHQQLAAINGGIKIWRLLIDGYTPSTSIILALLYHIPTRMSLIPGERGINSSSGSCSRHQQ